jgi:hypothetical protein
MPEESITSAVKLKAPDAVAVPVMAPDAGFRVRPGGNEPLIIENVYGETPPLATRLESYERATCPEPAAHANVRAGQVNGAGLVPWPFTFMVWVDPELVRVADPVTLQLPDMPPKAPVAVSVAVEAVAVNVMLPGTTLDEPPHVRVKV